MYFTTTKNLKHTHTHTPQNQKPTSLGSTTLLPIESWGICNCPTHEQALVTVSMNMVLLMQLYVTFKARQVLPVLLGQALGSSIMEEVQLPEATTWRNEERKVTQELQQWDSSLPQNQMVSQGTSEMKCQPP